MSLGEGRSPPVRLPQGEGRLARAGSDPPGGSDAGADPDVDGVALAAATAGGVVLGTWFVLPAAWVAAALCLVMACLVTVRPYRLRHLDNAGATGAAAGLVVLGTLLASGAAAASVRATAVRGGVLLGRAAQDGRVEIAGTVAEEPRRLRHGGHWVVLTVDHARVDNQDYRTRERAGVVLASQAVGPPGQGSAGHGGGLAGPDPPPRVPVQGSAGHGAGVAGADRSPSDRLRREDLRLGVGDRLRLRASVEPARWADRLGRRPPVVLRHPVVEGRAPPAGAALRVSEAVRDAARSRASTSLSPDRAGLLVGMALGDTSLLPADLERDFRAAGLTHLMAVSGANLAVVLAAGLWLAGAAGAGRTSMAAVGIVLVVVLVVVTRWEPSVLRAGVMAGLVLLGVATGRGPGGRRALCLAVVVLLLADPALVGAPGFQLSVVATAGVLWLGPLAAGALPGRIPERVRKAVGITLGAQAAAVPALALALGPVSLAGLPANLLGLPLAGGPMLLGVVVAATAPIMPWAATLACRLAEPFLVALIAVARWGADLPGGSVTLGGPARAVPALGLVLVVIVAAGSRRRSPYLPGAVGRPPTDIERTTTGTR
jgi:ComEC/Rec2-related protein